MQREAQGFLNWIPDSSIFSRRAHSSSIIVCISTMTCAFSGLNRCLNRVWPLRNSSIGLRLEGLVLMCTIPFSTSYSGQKFVSTASLEYCIVNAGSNDQLVVHGCRTTRTAGPSALKPFCAFLYRSMVLFTAAWATYGIRRAATISTRFFRHCGLPIITFPARTVVVLAPNGVAPLRWLPVFM